MKSVKLRFHRNNTRNEVMICFSSEEEAQLALTKINTYQGWRTELYKLFRKSRELERQRNQVIEPRNMNKEKTMKGVIQKLFKRRNKIHKKNTRHTTEEATKFLLKISQCEFLVMTEQSVLAYKLFCH